MKQIKLLASNVDMVRMQMLAQSMKVKHTNVSSDTTINYAIENMDDLAAYDMTSFSAAVDAVMEQHLQHSSVKSSPFVYLPSEIAAANIMDFHELTFKPTRKSLKKLHEMQENTSFDSYPVAQLHDTAVGVPAGALQPTISTCANIAVTQVFSDLLMAYMMTNKKYKLTSAFNPNWNVYM